MTIVVGILAFFVGLMLRPECQRCGEFDEEQPTTEDVDDRDVS